MDGYLRVSAYDQNVGKPVSGARILIAPSEQPERVIDEIYTDDSGQTLDVRLPAPPIDYSMYPNQPQPYSRYDVSVYANGYDDYGVKGAQILPDEETLQDIILLPRSIEQYKEITIPPSTLYGSYPEKIPEDEVKALPSSTGFVVLPEPVIPEYIVVHAGVPASSSAPNYWVPFKDYMNMAINIPTPKAQ